MPGLGLGRPMASRTLILLSLATIIELLRVEMALVTLLGTCTVAVTAVGLLTVRTLKGRAIRALSIETVLCVLVN